MWYENSFKGCKRHSSFHTGDTFQLFLMKKSCRCLARQKKQTRVHTGERPFSWPHCRKSFSASSHRKTHIRVHTGLKPFICTLCKKSFSGPSAFRRHSKVHIGEKPFICVLIQTDWRGTQEFTPEKNLTVVIIVKICLYDLRFRKHIKYSQRGKGHSHVHCH